MITCEHSVIRTADPDDAYELHRLHKTGEPRAFLADRRRELVIPTLDELTQVLTQRDRSTGSFFVVEDREGCIRGFCTVRGVNPEARFGEMALAFSRDDDYASPLASEAFHFLCTLGFTRMGLAKLIGHCLKTETALRAFFVAHGFVSDGVQREVLYTGGRYLDMETLTLCRPST